MSLAQKSKVSFLEISRKLSCYLEKMGECPLMASVHFIFSGHKPHVCPAFIAAAFSVLCHLQELLSLLFAFYRDLLVSLVSATDGSSLPPSLVGIKGTCNKYSLFAIMGATLSKFKVRLHFFSAVVGGQCSWATAWQPVTKAIALRPQFTPIHTPAMD